MRFEFSYHRRLQKILNFNFGSWTRIAELQNGSRLRVRKTPDLMELGMPTYPPAHFSPLHMNGVFGNSRGGLISSQFDMIMLLDRAVFFEGGTGPQNCLRPEATRGPYA